MPAGTPMSPIRDGIMPVQLEAFTALRDERRCDTGSARDALCVPPLNWRDGLCQRTIYACCTCTASTKALRPGIRRACLKTRTTSLAKALYSIALDSARERWLCLQRVALATR